MTDERPGIVDAMVKGALAGLAGGAALLAAERLERELFLPSGASNAGAAERAVSALATERGVELSRPAAAAAGAGAQLAWCALWGAVYGAVHSTLDAPAVVDGLALAGIAYAAARSKSGLLPRLGVAPPATAQNMEQTGVDLGAHLAYGLATAAVFDAAI